MPELNTWPGLFADTDPHSNPGSQAQENCSGQSLGKLSGRKGMREVWFGANVTARSAPLPTITDIADCIAMASFQRPEGEVVVWLDTAGIVRYGSKVT